MGLFNFVKEAGEKLWDNLTDHKGQSDKITEHLKKLNIPGSDKVKVDVNDGKAVVTGDGLTQEQKEKIQVAVGNIAGVSEVENTITATDAKDEATYYTVKSGEGPCDTFCVAPSKVVISIFPSNPIGVPCVIRIKPTTSESGSKIRVQLKTR